MLGGAEGRAGNPSRSVKGSPARSRRLAAGAPARRRAAGGPAGRTQCSGGAHTSARLASTAARAPWPRDVRSDNSPCPPRRCRQPRSMCARVPRCTAVRCGRSEHADRPHLSLQRGARDCWPEQQKLNTHGHSSSSGGGVLTDANPPHTHTHAQHPDLQGVALGLRARLVPGQRLGLLAQRRACAHHAP